MKRIIISDLHIGSTHCREEELVQFIQTIECDELILAGDIVDFIKVPSFTSETAKLLKMLSRFNRVIYIIGNHDHAFAKFVNGTVGNIEFHNCYEFMDGNRKFRIEHGDKYDNSFWHTFTEGVLIKVISVFQDWIERRWNIDLATWWANRKIKKRKLIRIWDIINLNNDVDVFIMGHSHTPEAVIWVDEDQNIKTYINSGDWVAHTTYVNIEEGVCRLRKFEVLGE
ncbi:MAG: UDP-2,3-diacylglucosamine diphosphatase [candidate division WOR-3 bacterium]|nr:MAG: UDP-2,3-diacylglucosamine diphosphatase [candidate division WOR-3 bacterium]